MAETMKKKIISNIKLGDMTAVFEQSEDTGKVGFYIMPADLAEKSRVAEKYYRVNNMIQLKIVGDIYPGSYGNGQNDAQFRIHGPYDLPVTEGRRGGWTYGNTYLF